MADRFQGDNAAMLKGIRTMAKIASVHRLAGRIEAAQRCDRQVDRLHIMSEGRGIGDAAVQAEEDGRADAR